MVKNQYGGSKHKKMSSKSFKQNISNGLRTAEDEDELYAIITQKLGYGHILAIGIDNTEYMVHIGGKFNSEIKNMKKYDFILIGKRVWETTTNKKQPRADLLEIYNETDKKKLLKINGNNWNVLLRADTTLSKDKNNNMIDDIIFSNEDINDFDEKPKSVNVEKEEKQDMTTTSSSSASMKKIFEEEVDDDFINSI